MKILTLNVLDIGMLCGNITEPRYLRSPKLINELTVKYLQYLS